jgi:hypothetical protein
MRQQAGEQRRLSVFRSSQTLFRSERYPIAKPQAVYSGARPSAPVAQDGVFGKPNLKRYSALWAGVSHLIGKARGKLAGLENVRCSRSCGRCADQKSLLCRRVRGLFADATSGIKVTLGLCACDFSVHAVT